MENRGFYEKLSSRRPHLMELSWQAAVLLAFVVENGEWAVVLEQRASTLNHQPGEICLPGGRLEEGETPAQAALRETCEELLVQPDHLTLWGAGDVLAAPGGRVIHPFLGELRDYGGSFSPDEVDDVFTVPVRWLQVHPPHRWDARVSTNPREDFPFERIPGGKNYRWGSGKWPVYFYDYPGRCIWGLTAKILFHTLEMVEELGGLPGPD